MKNTSTESSEANPTGFARFLSATPVFSVIILFGIMLGGCDKKTALESDNQELEHKHLKFMSTNIWISEISGRPKTFQLTFDVSVGKREIRLDYYLLEDDDRCKNRIIIKNEFDEQRLNQVFDDAEIYDRCFFAGDEVFNNVAMREIIRSIYLIFFPTVPFSMNGELQKYVDAADRKVFYKYGFDISARTPVHYSWRRVEDGCARGTKIKVTRISKVSSLLIPSTAVMEIGAECNSEVARYYIEFRNPRVK